MNPLIQAQVDAAQASVKPYNWELEAPSTNETVTKYGRELQVIETVDGDFASAEVKSTRTVEGPKLEEAKQTRSPVHAGPSPEPWGKPNRR